MAGEVNREAWAQIVRDELLPLTKGKKATLARLLEVDPKTIDLWLKGSVAVSQASVHKAAEKTGQNAMELLIRAGFYSLDEMPARPAADELIDEEIAVVADDPTLTDEQKMQIIEELESWRAEDRELQQRMAERDKERRMQRLRERVEQARRAI